MSTFLKAQAAAIAGSLLDFATTFALVEYLHCIYLIGNLMGNVAGGTMQFILCSTWVFPLSGARKSFQAIRFVIVFAGNLLLSAAGFIF